MTAKLLHVLYPDLNLISKIYMFLNTLDLTSHGYKPHNPKQGAHGHTL